MPSKTRLANKTQWALGDILALCIDARMIWQDAMKRADKTMDAVLMASLARLSDRLARIESIARDAQQGEYDERKREIK